ncbi:hypothetical protein SYNTR_1709 [Candidatus Syntrophocurvum alkaliphilum]|uniref:GGDEF domain-containing protein n=1 Tax=Candidatus Syntrophocurvum alkaliphilum TaxID=2293317 RepID=A0A6I6DJN7_9FIRM|nr:GGDEF domain-containing protein [Candidatus Syntrophocurvum alkaliphilum]QGU00303.1 hypothetical protein SYNTR_1709 [Candidatus Syntrophocurvum alkaliphilum]
MLYELLITFKSTDTVILLLILAILANILLKLVKVDLLMKDKVLIALLVVGLFCLLASLAINFANKSYFQSIVFNLVFYIFLVLGATTIIIYIHKALGEIIYLATYDQLTGIYNKNNLHKMLKNKIMIAQKRNRPLSILFIDINNFKSINDDLGHEAGDIILYSVVQEIKKHIRKTDIFIRYGGDEFILILPETNKDDAEQIALRVEKQIINLEIDLNISISYGIANFPEDAKHTNELIEIADSRMYQHKNYIKAQPNEHSKVNLRQ